MESFKQEYDLIGLTVLGVDDRGERMVVGGSV